MIGQTPLDPAALTSTTIKPADQIGEADKHIGPTPTAPIFRNKWLSRAIWTGIVILVLAVFMSGGWLIYRAQSHKLAQVAASSSSPADNVTSSAVDLSNVKLNPAAITGPQVNVNGQLNINDQAVLLPSARPTDPTLGQIYLDQADHNLYFYNGTSFNSLGQTITNIVNTASTGVSSVQGQTGDVAFAGGTGVDITGTTIGLDTTQVTMQGNTFNGPSQLLQLNGTGNVVLGTGHSIALGNYSLTDDTGNNRLDINAGANSIDLHAFGIDFSLPSGGATTQTICTSANLCAAGNGSAVILGPNAAQPDASGNPSIFINNTGASPLLRLQTGGVDAFTVSNNGALTIAAGGVTVSSGGAAITGNSTITGTLNGLTGLASSGTITFSGLNSIGVVQTNGSGVLSTSNLNLATGPITGTLGTTNGGTGVNGSGATSGQLLIGNNSGFSLATLTQGAGINVTNSAGGITISAPTAGTCSTCANLALSNLTTTALNQSLLPGSAGTFNLGSALLPFGQLALAGTSASPASNNFLITGASTGGLRTITLPDASGTVAVSASGNVQLSAAGNITTIDNPTFATSVTTPLLQSSGTLAITPGGNLTVGAAGQQFTLQGNASSTITATSAGNVTTVGFTTPTSTRSILFPDAGGTVCTTTATTCSAAYALATGSNNYIQNQTSVDQTANFRITGTGQANTSILTPSLDTTTTTLSVGTTNASAINIGNVSNNTTTTVTGLAVFKPSSGNDSLTAFQIQNAAATSNLFVADTINTRIGIGTSTPTATLTVQGTTADNTSNAVHIQNSAGTSIINAGNDGSVAVGAGTGTFGNKSIGTKADIGDNNEMDAARYTTGSVGGQITSMSVYLTHVNSGDKFQLGIYADNGGSLPSTLVANTAQTTLSANNTWYTVPITATLLPNTKYWLAYNSNAGNANTDNLVYFPNTGFSTWIGQAFGTWPASYGGNASNNGFQQTSIYATFNNNPNLFVGPTGSSYFQSTTNNSSAFSLQNSNGAYLFNGDTTTSSTNLLTNGGFESNTNGWDLPPNQTDTITRDTANEQQGNASLEMTNTAAGDGSIYQIGLTNSTTYTLSFWAKASGVGTSVFNFGYAQDGATQNTAGITSLNNTIGTSWKLYTLTFTPSSVVTGIPAPYLFFTQNDSTSRNIWIDGVQLQTGSAATPFAAGGSLQVLGVVNSPLTLQPKQDSTQVLQVLNSSGTQLFNVDTVNAAISANTTVTIKNQTDTSTAFRVQNAAGSNVFGVDTASLIATATGTLQVSNSGGASATLITDSSGNLNISTPGVGSFDDEFTSTTQDPSWTFTSGGGAGATNTLASGQDTIAVAGGTDHDCWTTGMACPRLLRSGGGDGTYEAALNTPLVTQGSPTDTQAYSAGIMFYADNNDFVRFEFRADGAGVYVKAHKDIAGVGTFDVLKSTAPVSMSANLSRLRVKRSGSTWTLYYSLNGGTSYTNLGNFTDSTTMTQVGIYTDNAQNTGPSTAPALAEAFDYFRITPSTEGKLDAGSAVFRNAIDSASSFQIQTSTSGVALDVDTTNSRLGVNVAAPTATLSVQGNNSTFNQTALLVQNGLGNNLINLTNDGAFSLGQNTGAVGLTSQGTNNDSTGNVLQAVKITPTSNVVATGITVFFNASGTAPNNLFAVGIYSDNGGTIGVSGTDAPANLLASGTAGNFGSWRSVGFTSGSPLTPTLTAGTPYWLVVNTNDASGGTKLKYNSGSNNTSCTSSAQPYSGTPMPNSWTGGSCVGITTKQYSMFANLSNGAVVQVSQSGNATFANSTNSTTAFQVQNAAGTTLLGVDTTGNGTINIGALSNSAIVIGQPSGTSTLTVNGNSLFNCTLSVNGHIISAGTTPAILGTLANCIDGTHGTASISPGNDDAGTVTITTANIAGCTANGDMATITFASSYGTIPHVLLTPRGSAAAGLGLYTDTVATGSFKVGVVTGPANNTTYTFDYLVVQ